MSLTANSTRFRRVANPADIFPCTWSTYISLSAILYTILMYPVGAVARTRDPWPQQLPLSPRSPSVPKHQLGWCLEDEDDMDRILRGIMKYRCTDRKKMVEQFEVVRNRPEVSLKKQHNLTARQMSFISLCSLRYRSNVQQFDLTHCACASI